MVAIHAFGPTAWLVDQVDDPAAWAAGLDEMDLPGVEEIVPAEVSVVVRSLRSAHDAIGARLAEVLPRVRHDHDVEVLLEVEYDGDDLAAVAEATGLSVHEVVVAHSTAQYRVAFCGFSPGFAYLRGLPERLQLPRRDRPRTKVPAGAVAIAAHYSAVYPSPSPGGWHLLGHTDATVWDATQHPPTRLRPGTRVRFQPR